MMPSSDAMRRAALLLHALPSTDRDWLLDQLDPAQRAVLDGMLSELRELGIAPDAAMARRAIEERISIDAQPAFDSLALEQMVRLMRPVPAAKLARELRLEPAALIASLLRIDAWPWAASLLAQLGAVKRRQVEELLIERGQIRQAAARTLLALLWPRVQAASPDEISRTEGARRLPDSWRARLFGSWHKTRRGSVLREPT